MKLSSGQLVLIVILVGLVVATPLLAEARGLFGDFRDWFLADWTDLLDTNGDNATITSESFSAIGITVHYADGTSKDYNPDGFSLIPLRIVDPDTNQAVTSIDANIIVNLDYAGHTAYLTSNSFAGTFNWRMRQIGATANIYQHPDQTISASPSSLAPNSPTVVKSYTILTSTMTQILEDVGAEESTTPLKNYELKFYAILNTVNLQFSDGTTFTRSTAGYNALWEFRFTYDTPTLNSVSMTIETAPFY